jgi:hypothetical protein
MRLSFDTSKKAQEKDSNTGASQTPLDAKYANGSLLSDIEGLQDEKSCIIESIEEGNATIRISPTIIGVLDKEHITDYVELSESTFTKTIKIEAIKPNRLKIKLDFGSEILRAQNKTGELTVKWLHGAKAKGLKADIEMTLVKGSTKFDGFDGYSLYKHKDEDVFLDTNIKNFKFASGWCNLLSADLFRDLIDFTYDLGHYGPDDTFIMNVLDHYKFNKNKNINQYIIKNIVVTENYKHSLNQYKGYITNNNNVKTKKEFTDDVKQAVGKRLNEIING